MSGYFLPGFSTLQGDDLSQTARTPVDTGNSTLPQSGGVIVGTQILYSAAITAKAGGTKAAATQLGYGENIVTVCATAANSVLLPYAFPGSVVIVSNDGAAAAQVFGKGTDTVDSVATATGVVLTNAKRCIYYGVSGTGDGTDAGNWVSLMGVKSA